MSLIKLRVLSTPSSTITDFSIITTGWVGATERDRKKEGSEEKADMYCGCVMTGMEDKKNRKGERGRMWRCLDSPQRRKSVRECCKREGKVSSKKPVAECADPVAPSSMVNNHHKPWLRLMNPPPIS